MLVEFRLRIVPWLVVLTLGASALAGCRKDRDRADDANKANATGVAPNPDELKRSLDELQPRITELTAKFATLHKQVDPLPSDLPGFNEVRGKFYATDEGLGRISGKVAWLSGRLEAARKSGNREELREISTDIAKTHDDLRQIDRVVLELIHQVPPFQRMAAALNGEDAAALGASFIKVLTTGYEVKGAKDGFEERLTAFIDDPKSKIDAATPVWFDFDGVAFTGDGGALDVEGSKTQLQNVVEILKAYPNVKLDVAGYTDPKGKPPASKKLAAERAEAVKKELVRLGVDETRLHVANDGAKPPPCTAKDKDACKGRLVTARVTAK